MKNLQNYIFLSSFLHAVKMTPHSLCTHQFEVSSFSRSRDIGVRILKILALSAILKSTLSGF